MPAATTKPSPATKAQEGEQIERVLEGQDRPFDAESEQPLEPSEKADEGHTRKFQYTTFSRMPKSWIADDYRQLMVIQSLCRQIIDERFAEAIAVMRRIRRRVRLAQADDDGAIIMNGSEPLWERDEDGLPVEDWTALGRADREALLFTITTHMFEWERARADLWRDAMFAKAQWEEKFAKAYHEMPGVAISGKPTIDDKTQVGHSFSISERYFAVFRSSLSKEADGIIQALKMLQRLLERDLTS